MQIIYAYNMTIKNSQFIKNKASKLSKNIFIGFSNVSITQCSFEDELMSASMISSKQDILIKGAFIHLIMGVQLNITGSTFVNGYAQMGGAIYLSGCK